MFEAKPDYLEVFRYFRMNYFNSVDEFYINFYKLFLPNNLPKLPPKPPNELLIWPAKPKYVKP